MNGGKLLEAAKTIGTIVDRLATLDPITLVLIAQVFLAAAVVLLALIILRRRL